MIDKLTKKQLIQLIILLGLAIAIPLSVFLVQNTQIFKGKAYQDEIFEAFEFKDSSGNILSCDATTNPPTCTTQSPDITVTIKSLDVLIPK
ncbi:MAG: hypothetical protein Q8P92_01025 [Candidatus Daviesbacteria bacterium]|nr:hypothetical protein [Candidatus Daviesbacteria bacterium]